MPLTEQEAIQKLWDLGHFANPSKPNTYNVDEADLGKLKIDDPIVKEAVQSYQDFMAVPFDRLSNFFHQRPGYHDGETGPATQALFETARCAVPDYRREPLPAVGTGNWARCHGIGNFHAATAYINKGTMPAFLRPLWDRVWANVVASYKALGLQWIETDNAQQHNTSLTWVRPDGGWIGLAIIGRGQSCGGKIWSRYDQNYKGGSSEAAIIQQWTSLVKHELGHNCGLEHSRGGVMNPSIIGGLPVSWKGDPSEPTLNKWFGGEPIPGGDPDPGPGPDPDPIPGPTGRPSARLSVTIPAGVKPGTYDLITVPRPEV